MPFVPDEEEETSSGFVPDDEPPPRGRRLVLDPVHVVAGEDVPRATGGRVEAIKAPPTPPTPRQRREWEIRDQRDAFERERLSPFWAGRTSGPGTSGMEEVVPAAGRTASRFWEQTTLATPERPIVGRDERSDAALLGAADALTFGFHDEMVGAADAARGGDYEASRDSLRARAHRAAELAPEATAAGEVAGSVPYMAIPGASAEASFGRRLAIGGATGGVMGAAGGIGRSEAEGFDSLQDASIPALLGAGLGLGGEAAASALTRSSPDTLEHLSRFRDRELLAATGTRGHRQTSIQAFDRGTTPREIARSRASAAETLRGTGVVPQVGTVGMVGRRAEAATERALSAMDDIRSAMDGGGPTGLEVAERLRRQAASVRTAMGAQRREVLEDAADRIAERYAAQPIGYDEVIAETGDLRSQGAYRTRAGRDVPLREQGLDEIDQTIRGAYDDAVEEGLGLGERDAYRRARREYAVLLRAGANARRGEAGGSSGLLETVMMGAGAGAGAQLGGAGGAGLGAVALPLAMRAGRAVSPTLRATGADALYRLAQAHPERLGRHARGILEAGQRGASALITYTTIQAQRDAELRQLLMQAQQEQEQ